MDSTTKKVFLFTGQSAQYEGMGRDLYENYGEVRDIFGEAEEILKIRLKDICFDSPLEELSKTSNLQPSIFCISAGIFEILKKRGTTPSAVAGFSLGEITAVYASEMLSLKDTLLLIQKRGEVMDAACQNTQGSMYSILNFDDAKLEKICKDVSGYVIPANFNSPGQTVISGETEAAEEAAKTALEQGAKRAVKLNVAGAFHSELMNYKKDELKQFLSSLNFKKPICEFYSNLYGKAVEPQEDWNNFMYNYIPEQMSNPVRFRQEIEELSANGYKDFYEIGVGKVLTGLIRRTVENANIFTIENKESIC